MRYKCTGARIGQQFARRSLVERETSVFTDGREAWTLVAAQSREQNTALSTRRLLWGRILPPLDAPDVSDGDELIRIPLTLRSQ
jgi:hypothetical protein